MLPKIKALNEIAESRNQNLTQVAIYLILKDERITSVLIESSKITQILDCIEVIKNTTFSLQELEEID